MNLLSSIILFLCSFKLLTASQVTFDKASREDALTMQDHLVFFYSQEFLKAALFQDDISALEAAKEEILQESADSPTCYFYLTHDDTHYGYIAYSIDKETAYIESLYLDEKYRGLGIGKAALSSLELELRKTRINVIKLYVFAHNQAAFTLYKKMGYLIENTYFNHELPIGYHMKKELLRENSASPNSMTRFRTGA